MSEHTKAASGSAASPSVSRAAVSALRLDLGHAVERIRLHRNSRDETGIRIEAAVETAGKTQNEPYEAWISAGLFHGGVQVLITGRHGFQRTVRFAIDEDPPMMRACVRETLEAE